MMGEADYQMECSEHPSNNNNPAGGICAFCLQERLGKLVSSSSFFPAVLGAPNSSASSPTRSDSSAAHHHHHHHLGRSKIPPFLSHKQKKVMSSSSAGAGAGALVLKRSRSVAVPRYLSDPASDDSPRRRGFWSFLHLSRRRAAAGGVDKMTAAAEGTVRAQTVATAAVAENGCESPNGSHVSSTSSFGRKVARSRSVGCGSRSFSGDFLERISTGFGDCTLRRVESQREAKSSAGIHHRAAAGDDDRIKERVRCGGIFAGFGMSSSSYWFSDELAAAAGRMTAVPHSRSRSWSWAFASPMRAFRPTATTTTIKSTTAAAAAVDNKIGASAALSTVRG